MNDERFDIEMRTLALNGRARFAGRLRARDTAQREALARAERTVELWKEQYDSVVRYGNELLVERDTALFQLTEVLRILDQHRVWTGMGWEQLPVPVHAVERIRRKIAQAEQQEAQYISVQEVWEAAGGNPGIKADREQLLFALKTLDQVCDEAQGAQAEPANFGQELETFEKWRHAQADSLRRCGYPEGADAFIRLGSVQWAGWQARAALATQHAEAAPVEAMSFEYVDLSGERRTVTITRDDVIEGMEDALYEKLSDQICRCEPIGETNVVECNCQDYVEEFTLVSAKPAVRGADHGQ